MPTAVRRVELGYTVPVTDPRWVLEDDDNMPETEGHTDACGLLLSVLKAWIADQKRDARVLRNLALRWDPEHPKVGVDPDVMLVEPSPSERVGTLRSLCTWKPGHHPPRVAIEVVSESTAEKDYGEGPNKYAASGTAELWVFDPEGFGPRAQGGPYVLQLWRRGSDGRFTRRYEGEGPAFSDELNAWLVVVEKGTRLRIADDEEGQHLWPTFEERERAAKEAALAENEGLRAEIARLRRG